MKQRKSGSIAFTAALTLLSGALASAMALAADMDTYRSPACDAAQASARFDFERQRTDGSASPVFRWEAPAECRAGAGEKVRTKR